MKRAFCTTLVLCGLAVASVAAPLPPDHQPGTVAAVAATAASITATAGRTQPIPVAVVKVSANQNPGPAVQTTPASANRLEKSASPEPSAWQRYGPWLAALGVMFTIALRRARSEKR